MTQTMNQSVNPSTETLTTSRDEAARANRVAAFRWGSLVVALLFSQIFGPITRHQPCRQH